MPDHTKTCEYCRHFQFMYSINARCSSCHEILMHHVYRAPNHWIKWVCTKCNVHETYHEESPDMPKGAPELENLRSAVHTAISQARGSL